MNTPNVYMHVERHINQTAIDAPTISLNKHKLEVSIVNPS